MPKLVHSLKLIVGRKKKTTNYKLSTTYFNVKQGFTLIELLITIAILGILAASILILINPVKKQSQAKDATIKASMEQIVSALQNYYTSHLGTYPSESDGLPLLVTTGEYRGSLVPPAGGTYEYQAVPSGCQGTDGSPCSSVSLSEPLYDPGTAGNVWCWQSASAKVHELPFSSCIP